MVGEFDYKEVGLPDVGPVITSFDNVELFDTEQKAQEAAKALGEKTGEKYTVIKLRRMRVEFLALE